ncbi:hypothetical protein JX265_000185 [Neoarthrinium moseri]|uniref:Uncharacterized protein n=1 Tax=Neoarthrinium moseri TaxID=1658444 RepID=A0A9P9WY23_9PEZI|nr:uncharacterized protein JN550_001115 [Neoarthrinium moseri]KAI1853316.1 hypothetical protein JX266_002022 [Neoarthrinium moseri]KAI1877043.1 hypothetical protein JN550_001115 [Neoarthrinium moseri]KAI1881359.1 hypothetical protein JX265_000185 [Neoarthrinium moseri]
MDPLKSLTANAPDWVKRLDELNGQIEQRQRDLAKLAETERPKSSARSIRNQGSTESLKPKDDGAAFPSNDVHRNPAPATPAPRRSTPPRQPSQSQQGNRPPSSPGSDRKSPSSLQRQTNEVVATAQRRARAVLRKRQKTDSMISGEGAPPTYRTRSMILVYYDSYVQSFFEELVKFVSAQRNLMRKAKMAAKVAQIKRLAELEMPDDDDDDDNDVDDPLQPGDALIAADPAIASRPPREAREDLKLRYVSTRMMGPTSRMPHAGLAQMRGSYGGMDMLNRGLSDMDQPSDVFDELDRGLEFVQGMCERAAHQFLRDGDCEEEIAKIKRRLAQTKEVADHEMERLSKENPNVLSETAPPNARSYRPSTMRRDPGASVHSKKKQLEVDDEGVEDM